MGHCYRVVLIAHCTASSTSHFTDKDSNVHVFPYFVLPSQSYCAEFGGYATFVVSWLEKQAALSFFFLKFSAMFFNTVIWECKDVFPSFQHSTVSMTFLVSLSLFTDYYFVLSRPSSHDCTIRFTHLGLWISLVIAEWTNSARGQRSKILQVSLLYFRQNY